MSIPVYSAIPDWGISGVNVFSLNLLEGLRSHGFEPHALSPHSDCLSNAPALADSQIAFVRLPLRWYDSPPESWGRLQRHLSDHAPCVYLPNFDWFSAWQSVSLPPNVSLVLVLHSDEECYYELARAVGPYCDALVAVSDAIGNQVKRRWPELASKLTNIPYGVPYPARLPSREQAPGGPLKIIYAGRIIEYQKRILDLPKIANSLYARGIPFELTLVGDGPERREIEFEMRGHIAAGRVRMMGKQTNQQTCDLFARHDVFILTSEFEGLPVALLEAMGQGCVPVVTDIRSGIPQVLRQGENGFAEAIGDIEGFTDRLAELQGNLDLRRRMSEQAYIAIERQQFRVVDMCARYAALFHSLQGKSNPLRPANPRNVSPNLPQCEELFTWRFPPQVRRALLIAYGNFVWLTRRLRRMFGGSTRETPKMTR